MIARIWKGNTRPGKGREYFEYLEQTGLKEYRETPGFRGVLALRREIGDQSEYLLITLWESMEAVKGFAGPQPDLARYYPEDERYFSPEEMRPHVSHYDVLVSK
jgi:heme-degrading monooxygenase HmoA